MDSRPTLVLGTRNEKKREELAALLAPLNVHLITLSDVADAIEVLEDGDSFRANAVKKASHQARHLGRWVLGEDSGLSVDALNGQPGIYSARYAGPGASDEANNRRLVAELGDTPLAARTAHYVCNTALADPEGQIRAESEGRCHGRIRFEPAGEAGFGYDPLFEVIEYHRTFGELGGVVKSAISHRARALERLVPQLARLIRDGAWPA